MIDFEWLQNELVQVLRWQLAHPGREDDPEAPEVPFAGRRVWSIFLDLNSERSVGFGPGPITSAAIEAWARLRREPVRPWELTIIRALDAAFLDKARDTVERQGKSADQRYTAETLTPEMFRAMFR